MIITLQTVKKIMFKAEYLGRGAHFKQIFSNSPFNECEIKTKGSILCMVTRI